MPNVTHDKCNINNPSHKTGLQNDKKLREREREQRGFQSQYSETFRCGYTALLPSEGDYSYHKQCIRVVAARAIVPGPCRDPWRSRGSKLKTGHMDL